MTSNTPETQSLLPVTQADRDAAADMVERDVNGVHTGERSWQIRGGHLDGDYRVQAFARHRISHSLPGDVGIDHRADMANVGEALMEAIRDYSGHAFMQHWHPADCPSEIVGDLLNALDEADGWRSVAGLPMWWAGIVTDGEHVAFAQKAEADFDGYYWAVDPEDALEWEPTHCIAAPGSKIAALTPSATISDATKRMEQTLGATFQATPSALSDLQRLGQEYDGDDKTEGPFHVSRSSDGEKHWFSARDPAAGVTIPAKDRNDAYALVASLNRSCTVFALRALTTPPTPDRIGKDAVREALEKIAAGVEERMHDGTTVVVDHPDAMEIARAALQHKGEAN